MEKCKKMGLFVLEKCIFVFCQENVQVKLLNTYDFYELQYYSVVNASLLYIIKRTIAK